MLLRAMLNEHCPMLNIIADCEDLPSGIKAMKREKTDLIFLDIEMPGHSGLELLDFFNEDEVNFDIIFTTAYSEYAIRAFKMSAIDYLLKPIQVQELTDAVDRTIKKQGKFNSLKLLRDNLSDTKSKKIVLNQSRGIEFIDTDDILFMKGNGAYTEIHRKEGGFILASKNLKQFEELLSDQPHFFRTHKSYIVNTRYINNIQREDGVFNIAFGSHVLAISPDKINTLLEILR